MRLEFLGGNYAPEHFVQGSGKCSRHDREQQEYDPYRKRVEHGIEHVWPRFAKNDITPTRRKHGDSMKRTLLAMIPALLWLGATFAAGCGGNREAVAPLPSGPNAGSSGQAAHRADSGT